MSQVKTILNALVKLGVATYDDLQGETKIERNKLRWSCNTMKTDGNIKQTEEPLTKEVAWQITPQGRAHLIKIAGESIVAAPPLKSAAEAPAKAAQPITADMARTKAKAVKKSKALQDTPAGGGANNTGSRASDSHVVAASTSSEGAAVVEQQAGAIAPMEGVDSTDQPAGSDVPFYQPSDEARKDFSTWAESQLFQVAPEAAPVEFTDPQLFAMVSIDGTLHIAFAGNEINLPAFAVRQLGEFLSDTEPAWA